MLKFDEINKLKTKSLPYEQYFGEMTISNDEKEKRIELAKQLEPIFLFLFAVITKDSLEYCYEMVSRRYSDAVSVIIGDEITENGFMAGYINSIAKDIVDSTIKNESNVYFKSTDRAKYLAENESNTVANYYQQVDAIKDGCTQKTWISMQDKKVRHTHEEVDGETIGIEEAFIVGNSRMLYPKDTSLGASSEEIVNCRCSVIYS